MRKRNQKSRKTKNRFSKEGTKFVHESEAIFTEVLHHQLQTIRLLFQLSKRAKTHVANQRDNFYGSIKRAFRQPPPAKTLAFGSFGGLFLAAVFYLGMTSHRMESATDVTLAADRDLKTASQYVTRASFYIHRKMFEDADRVAITGMKIFPGDINLIGTAASIAEATGNFQKAWDTINKNRMHFKNVDQETRLAMAVQEERILFKLKQLREELKDGRAGIDGITKGTASFTAK